MGVVCHALPHFACMSLAVVTVLVTGVGLARGFPAAAVG
jgi:hypothetical protein